MKLQTSRTIFLLGISFLFISISIYLNQTYQLYSAFKNDDNLCKYFLAKTHNYSEKQIFNLNKNMKDFLVNKNCFISDEDCEYKFKMSLPNDVLDNILNLKSKYNDFRNQNCRIYSIHSIASKEIKTKLSIIFPIELSFKIFILLLTLFLYVTLHKHTSPSYRKIKNLARGLFLILFILGFLQCSYSSWRYFSNFNFLALENILYFPNYDKLNFLLNTFNIIFLILILAFGMKKLLKYSEIEQLEYFFAGYIGTSLILLLINFYKF